MTPWRHWHDYMTSQNSLIFIACRSVRKMISCLFIWLFGLLNQEVSSHLHLHLHDDFTSCSDIMIMTSRHDITTSHFTDLSLLMRYNWAIFLFTWLIGRLELKAYYYCFNFIWWHDVTTRRHDATLWHAGGHHAKIASIIVLILTTQITMEFK